MHITPLAHCTHSAAGTLVAHASAHMFAVCLQAAPLPGPGCQIKQAAIGRMAVAGSQERSQQQPLGAVGQLQVQGRTAAAPRHSFSAPLFRASRSCQAGMDLSRG